MNLHMVLIEVEHWATLVLVFIGYRWLLFHSLVFSIHVLWIVFFFFCLCISFEGYFNCNRDAIDLCSNTFDYMLLCKYASCMKWLSNIDLGI